MRRRAAGLTLLSALVIGGFMESPASAGGNFINFNRDYLVPGKSVVATNAFAARSDVVHGPYYAYLLPEVEGWDPSLRVYRESIVLGRVRIAVERDGGESQGAAKLKAKFEIPHVSPGEYLVGFCNLPCTHSLDLDIQPTAVQVVRSPLKAHLLEKINDARAYASRVESRIGTDQWRGDRKLRGQIQATQDHISRNVGELEQSIAGIRQTTENKPGWSAVIALVLVGMAMSAITTLLFSRRRRKAVGSPDPFDRLLEESERELAGRV